MTDERKSNGLLCRWQFITSERQHASSMGTSMAKYNNTFTGVSFSLQASIGPQCQNYNLQVRSILHVQPAASAEIFAGKHSISGSVMFDLSIHTTARMPCGTNYDATVKIGDAWIPKGGWHEQFSVTTLAETMALIKGSNCVISISNRSSPFIPVSQSVGSGECFRWHLFLHILK